MDYIVPKISITVDERGCSNLEAATFSLPRSQECEDRDRL